METQTPTKTDLSLSHFNTTEEEEERLTFTHGAVTGAEQRSFRHHLYNTHTAGVRAGR